MAVVSGIGGVPAPPADPAPPAISGRAGLGARALVALLVAGAAAIHTLLTPEHFEEGFYFGVFFTLASVYQWWLALALLSRPGPPVYRAGIWGSAALVATWMGSRLIAPPGAEAPEPVTLEGVVATGLEIAAIVALAAALPSCGPPPGPTRRRLLAAGIGLGFLLLVIVASGTVTPIPPGRWTGPDFLFRVYPLPSWRLTGVWMVALGRWSALIPWLALGFAASGGVLVAWTVALALRLSAGERGAARGRGVLAAVPACATVPVCCGAPLTAFAGGVAVGILFRWTPWLMAASLVLLTANVVLLRRQLRRRPSSPDGPVEHAFCGGADQARLHRPLPVVTLTDVLTDLLPQGRARPGDPTERGAPHG